ncbi:MAG: 1,4-dihydroxy-2-naphthoate octaprenyltransferase [Bacteroidaceae bacterium]|nr:1,4-dihydroxy-2-naphthoate octaprenyltransferase [Bacteroidaceae bacterium]
MGEKIEVNSFKAWILGIRPTSLGASLMTVLLGAGLAHGFMPEQFSWAIALLCWVFAWLMHIAANLINDVVDFKRGLDKSDPERIDRIYANGLLTKNVAYTTIAICLVLGCLVGLTILYMVWDHLLWDGWEIVLMGAIVVACTFLYSTTFAYHGLGDLAVLLCFGLIPVCGTFYVLTYTVTWDAVWASIVAGCSIDTLLIVNNYRDRDEDYESGKYTSVGILGEPFGRWFYLIAGLVCVAKVVLLYIDGCISWIGLLYSAVPYLILHIGSWIKLNRIREGNALNVIYYESPRNFTLLGILLTIALW